MEECDASIGDFPDGRHGRNQDLLWFASFQSLGDSIRVTWASPCAVIVAQENLARGERERDLHPSPKLSI